MSARTIEHAVALARIEDARRTAERARLAAETRAGRGRRRAR